MKWLTICLAVFLLTACQTNTITGTRIPANKEFQAKGQDSRIQYIILHYTATDFKRSLELLTTNPVSSHYLIDDTKGVIYQLVDENNRAWHAGVSSWQGRTYLNASSIGVEIVNNGYIDTEQGRFWYPYSKTQIKSLISLLKDLKKRYKLPIENILGHSDIAPQRKTDPGPLFPWRLLAQNGLATWPNEKLVAAERIRFNIEGLPSIKWIQEKLALIGYQTPQTGLLDDETIKVIAAFQMHYQPEHFDGYPNSQTAALLKVISNKKFAIPQG